MRGRLGPLDKRRNVTRCMACARRHIKCLGGPPCEYCIRISTPCKPQPKTNTPPALHIISFPIPSQLPQPHDEIYLDAFSLFLDGCRFTSGFASVAADLLPLMSTPSSRRELRLAAVAIGALSASRRGFSRKAGVEAEKVAFGCYGRAVRGLHVRLNDVKVVDEEDVLWTTFLLGLFEVLSPPFFPAPLLRNSDMWETPSGETWHRHMLYGTARILELRGPSSTAVSPLQGKLLAAFQVLEANRVILYGEESALSKSRWESAQSGPLEGMLGLVMEVARFSKRFFQVVESTPEMERFFHPSIATLAQQGLLMQQRIQHWTILRRSSVPEDEDEDEDNFTHLARSYHHALLLFLTRNYTYYPCWQGLSVPSLTPLETTHSTMEILDLAERIGGGEGDVPGVLLLFPLRMAGAHAKGVQREEIIRMLGRIYQKGFVVSDRIALDLRELWADNE